MTETANIQQIGESLRTSVQKLSDALERDKESLKGKMVEVPENTKHSDIATLIEQIGTATDPKARITVNCSDFYNGASLTFSNRDTSLTGTVKEGKCVVIVTKQGEWTVTNSLDGQTATVTVSFTDFETSLEKTMQVFGVKVEQANPDPSGRVTYTDDAMGFRPVTVGDDGKCDLGDWGDTWIFENIYPVMLNTNGTEAYRLDPNDLTRKADGGSSDAHNLSFDGNAMVRVGKFYSKLSSSDGYEHYQISKEKLDGFEAVGFLDENGNERDCVYMPCYLGHLQNDTTGRLRSIGSLEIHTSYTYDDNIKAAKDNGDGYALESHATVTVLDMLYLILLKNENSQTAVGTGRGLAYDVPKGTVELMSDVESVFDGAKTGVTDTFGPIGCDPGTGAVTFMWIEDYWLSNDKNGEESKADTDKKTYGYRWLEGMVFRGGDTYVKMKRPYYSDQTEGYTKVESAATEGGSMFISASLADNGTGRIPTACEGTANGEYQCDRFASDNRKSTVDVSVCYRCRGGIWYRGYTNPGNHNSGVGAGLVYEPAVK